MHDTFSSKIIWLTSRFNWFSESSPINETIVKIYDMDKYGNPRSDYLRTYTANSFQEAIELAFEVEKKKE